MHAPAFFYGSSRMIGTAPTSTSIRPPEVAGSRRLSLRE